MRITLSDAFARVPLLSDLPEDERAHLIEVLHEVAAQPGEVLFREGESGGTLYLVLEGRLDVLKGLGTSDERKIADAWPGDFLGEMSLLIPGRARTASIRAVEPSLLWTMTHADFSELLQRQPKVAFTMVQSLTRRLDDSNKAAFRDLQERNQRLQQAYDDLRAAQAMLIEKERLERELQVAAAIQMSILPQQLPQFAGFDFGALMQPARTVGGDLYDVFPMSAGQVGVVVGDVVGKGVPAAIFMARSHALIMSESAHGGPPGDILRRVNAHLIRLQQSDQFVTVLFGILDLAGATFHYARAGHELPLLLTADGEVRTLAMQPGQPLGLFDEVLLDESSISVPAGGTLLLNTDGLTDGSDPHGEQFGYERVTEVLSALAGRGGQQVCATLLQTLVDHLAGTEQDDDVTLVALHRTSSPDMASDR
jgi:serine phosphatase RsbU (regulator of sigma subunit)